MVEESNAYIAGHKDLSLSLSTRTQDPKHLQIFVSRTMYRRALVYSNRRGLKLSSCMHYVYESCLNTFVLYIYIYLFIYLFARVRVYIHKDVTHNRGLRSQCAGAPFELYKHWAKDPAWLGDPRGAERLLEDMDKPERFGDDQQEHTLTAMSRITYHLRRQKTESWREYFAKWDNAIRKVQQHKIVLPPEYEGFLMINGLQLTESDTKALLNYTHGCIKPNSIKSWLRKNETKLSASELGADRRKTVALFTLSMTAFMPPRRSTRRSTRSTAQTRRRLTTSSTISWSCKMMETQTTALSESEAAETLKK